MACFRLDLVCKAKEGAENAIGGAVQSGADNLGDIMMAAWDSLMKSFLTSWLDVGLLVPLEAGSVPWLTEQLHVFSVFFAVVGVMIACIWTMVHARGDKAIQVGKALFRVFLVTTLGTVLIQVVLSAGDAFSTWVLESAGVSSTGYKEVAGIALGVGPGLAIIAGIFGVIATLFQWGIMMVRAVVLPLLVAVWPLSAAASMVAGGEETFSKVTKWLVAFLLYKPVAAIIYAFAWKMKSGEDGPGGVISGMLLLVLAVAALPALMKLVAPGTSALGGAAGGGMAMAAGAAVVSAGVAVGAAVATGGASGGAAAGASAGSAGSGAATTSATTAKTAEGGGQSTTVMVTGRLAAPALLAPVLLVLALRPGRTVLLVPLALRVPLPKPEGAAGLVLLLARAGLVFLVPVVGVLLLGPHAVVLVCRPGLSQSAALSLRVGKILMERM